MASAKAAVRVIRPKRTEQPAAPLIRELLEQLVEDPQRDGLDWTPERVDEAKWTSIGSSTGRCTR